MTKTDPMTGLKQWKVQDFPEGAPTADGGAKTYFTASEVCEGNVFTGDVYPSMHWAGGICPGWCLPRGCLPRGVSV